MKADRQSVCEKPLSGAFSGTASRRQAVIDRVVSEAPESCQKQLGRAFLGSASPRGAIKAMCLSCTGFDRASVEKCTGYSCPLWQYRPFQKSAQQ